MWKNTKKDRDAFIEATKSLQKMVDDNLPEGIRVVFTGAYAKHMQYIDYTHWIEFMLQAIRYQEDHQESRITTMVLLSSSSRILDMTSEHMTNVIFHLQTDHVK